MGALRIVVANEPRAYREALARALQIQRPALHVILAEPSQLPQVLPGTAPDFLIATELSGAPVSPANSWLLLYPAGENLGIVCTACGSRRTIAEIDLDDILSLIDHLEDADFRSLGSGSPFR